MKFKWRQSKKEIWILRIFAEKKPIFQIFAKKILGNTHKKFQVHRTNLIELGEKISPGGNHPLKPWVLQLPYNTQR